MTKLFQLGLSLQENFITESEEVEIIKNIKNLPKSKEKWIEDGGRGRQEIKRFGSKKPYNTCMMNNVIPEFLGDLSKKIVDQKLLKNKPDSITVNLYLPGQAISPHVDSKDSGKIVTVLSLNSDATMIFTKEELKESILLPSRSLVQIRDKIRYDWKHSLEPVQNTRYSIVFRDSSNI